MTNVAQQTGSGQTAIRPFSTVNFPEAELTELRRRVSATHWPDRETVPDETQGVLAEEVRAGFKPLQWNR